ncbi:MAG: GNAT family N-acetyltransferase [Alphaproteobacteria bacterium]|nr:GNAT family N-acetyltransferase [Alphaproteobacteria bacterium]
MRELGPTLETDRLILRPPRHEDFPAFAAFAADERVMRFLGGVAPSGDAVWRGMAELAGSWALLGFGMFSVFEKDSGRWVGRLGPWRPAGADGAWPGKEVGWGLIADAQGKGYATEGAAATMDWAFDQLGWDEIIHCIEPRNAPSIAVAQRLGAQHLRDAVLPAPINVTVQCWGQTREQWRARR